MISFGSFGKEKKPGLHRISVLHLWHSSKAALSNLSSLLR
jgi:hypothetical protein